jgi:tRNA dimethylallyltransferase
MNKPKIIVICGPTATGKSDYAVELAQKINGEIISADSRQVYKGLDIGSGKITKREMRGVPHYLLDVASPKRTYSVAQYKKQSTQAIEHILKKSKTPIICGGTGFYIDAALGLQLPEVAPNKTLRKVLTKKTTDELFNLLQKKDPSRALTIDKKNKVRLIRALEIIEVLGKVPKQKKISKYAIEWIYLDFPDDVLKARIHLRLIKRLKAGMIAEVRNLHKQGLSWKRLETLGLEYRFIARYLQKKLSKQEMLEELEMAIWHYAKRQRTWFKKYGK